MYDPEKVSQGVNGSFFSLWIVPMIGLPVGILSCFCCISTIIMGKRLASGKKIDGIGNPRGQTEQLQLNLYNNGPTSSKDQYSSQDVEAVATAASTSTT